MEEAFLFYVKMDCGLLKKFINVQNVNLEIL